MRHFQFVKSPLMVERVRDILFVTCSLGLWLGFVLLLLQGNRP